MATKAPDIDTKAVKQQLDSDKRDIADMWNDALKSYRGILGVQLQPDFGSTQQMIDFATEQMNNFHRFRHNEKKVDKLRSLFAANLDYIQAGATQLVAAATPAFPPAAAIGTALTYMLKACKQVSADYDVVTAFFEDMNSFLQRITILETRLPKYPAYRNCLMDVFTSLLNMCGFATKYIERGRFKKWISNMISGEDSELGGARKKMDTSLDRLQAATEYAILGNTEELQKMNGELHENQMAQNRMLQEQTEMLASVLSSQDSVRSDLQNMTKLLQAFQENRKGGDSGAKATKGKIGAQSKPPTANRIVNYMPDTLNPAIEYRNIKDTFVADTGTWIFDEPAWTDWVARSDSERRKTLLTISGPAGMGKSHLAASAYDHLVHLAESNHETVTCVAQFYFRETEWDLQEFVNAMNWIVIQIAEQNMALCEKLNVEISREDLDIRVEDWESVWKHLVAPLFATENGPRLQIVFDGIDELEDTERMCFVKFLKMLGKKPDLHVSVLCTTMPNVSLAVDGVSQASILVEKDEILPDLRALVWHKLDNLDHLRRFSRYVKQEIATRLEEMADCLLYAELMLNRFNNNAREGAVLKALRGPLPADLEHLYLNMLSDCERQIPETQRQSIKTFLAWLAYSWAPLTLNECKTLMNLIIADKDINIEEELDGRLASFLCLNNSADEDADKRTKTQLIQKTEELEHMDNSLDSAYDDGKLQVKFKTRSMRGFFRNAQGKDEALRVPSSEAHRRISIACSHILQGNMSDRDEAQKGLLDYAGRNWASHLTWVSSANQVEAESIAFLESAVTVLIDQNGSASQFEVANSDYQDQAANWSENNLLNGLSRWASWASSLDQSKLDQKTSDWCQTAAEDKESAMVPLAKAHIKNWFNSRSAKSAIRSYKFARSATLLTGHKDVVHVDDSSDDDISESSDEDDEERGAWSAEEIQGIAKTFDVEMDSMAHFAVGLLLEHSEHYEEALLEIETGLSLRHNNADRSQVLVLRAEVLRQLERYEEARVSISEALAFSDLPKSLQAKALYTRGRIEDSLDLIEDSVRTYEESRLVDPSTALPGDILKEEIDLLERKDANDLISTLQAWTPLERLTSMTWLYDEDDGAVHETFRKAAIRAQKFDFLLEAYNEAIELLDPLDSAAPIQYQLALAYWLIQRDASASRETLNIVLDSKSYGFLYALTNEDPIYLLSQAINLMSDVLWEQFWSNGDALQKEQLLIDTKALLQRPLARALSTQRSDVVHHTVTIAKMTRKVGRSRDFQDELQKAFSICYDALDDNVGWNDADNLENLAEVLLTVGAITLEREARIAISARFSNLDPEIADDASTHDDGGSSESSESSEDSGSDEDSDESEKNQKGGKQPQPKRDDPTNGAVEPKSPTDQYDTIDDTIMCDGTCDPQVEFEPGWQTAPMYRCISCYDCNLCQSCHDVKQQLDREKAPKSMYHFCGPNHKYIKAPIEGWKGIKDGVMYIGDEETPFKEWLQDLKDTKWKQVWETFWTSED
ncbi:MAG: hypothetical protein M1820_007317 [Bogoriella megaspora]|nr:MAG: hypothetical protein M1820_007317 [Bogoriella megaspora]